MKSISARRVKEIAGGIWIGPDDFEISGVAEISEAGPGDLVYAVSGRFVAQIARVNPALAVLPCGDWTGLGCPHVKVDNPQLVLARVLAEMNPFEHSLSGVHPKAVVHPDALIGVGVVLYPGVYVDAQASVGDGSVLHANVVVGQGAVLGRDCLVYPNVTIREFCRLGDRVVLQPGAVVGSDGYGFIYDQGVHHKIPQIGIVEIGNDVELGANTTVDRGTFRSTVIGPGTKIDNQVQIGHNVVLGAGCLMAAQSGISGSTKVGDFVTFGGQSGSVGHIEIGAGTIVFARGVPTRDIPPKSRISGFPGQEHREELKVAAALRRVPELRNRVLKILKFLKIEPDSE